MDTWSNHTLTRNWASFLGSESPRIMHTKQDVPITNIGWDNYSNKSSTFYDFLPHMIFMQNMHQQITSAPWSRVTSSGAGHPWGHRYWRWLRPATRHEPGIGESIKRNVKVGEGDEHAKCAQLQRCIYLYISTTILTQMDEHMIKYRHWFQCSNYIPHWISYYQVFQDGPVAFFDRLQSDQKTP